MNSKLSGKEFHGIYSENNSPGLSTSPTENVKKDLSSRRFKLFSQEAIPNTALPSFDLDDEYSTDILTDCEYDSPSKKARISNDLFELQHNVSTNSFEPETSFEELQYTRDYKQRSSTPRDPLRYLPYSPELLKDISSVTIDGDQEMDANQGILNEDRVKDECSFLLNQQLNKCASTPNMTIPTFNLENNISLSNDLPVSISETNLNFKHFRSEYGEERDTTYSHYVTAEDYKSTSKNTVESRLMERTIETDKIKIQRNNTEVANPLQYELTQYQSQDTLTLNKSSTSIASTLNSSLPSASGTELDNEIESLKKEFDLESISDEDLSSDNIYEELSNILSEDFSSKENTFISKPNSEDLQKDFTVSMHQLNAYSGYDNINGNSILTESDSANSYCPTKEHLAATAINYKIISKSEFSEDKNCKEESDDTIMSNTVRDLTISTATLLPKEHVAHTAPDNCCTECHGCNNASNSGLFDSYSDSTTSDDTHTIVDDAVSTKDEINMLALLETGDTTDQKCRRENITNDIVGLEKMSNCSETLKTIENSFFSPDFSLEKNCPDRNIRNLHFNSSIRREHEEIPDGNDITISKPNKPRIQVCKGNLKNEKSAHKKESDSYKNKQLCHNYEDSSTSSENSNVTTNRISLFDKNKFTDILKEEIPVNSTKKSQEYTETHKKKVPVLLINEDNASTGNIRSESFYDVGHYAQEKRNNSLGLFGIKLYEINPSTSKNLNERQHTQRYTDDNMCSKLISNNVKATSKISESEFSQPSNNLPYVCDTENCKNNLKILKSSSRSITERNPFVVDYSKIKVEPLPDSYVNETGKFKNNGHTEMDQLSGVNCNFDTSYPQSSIDNVIEENSLVSDYSRLKIEPLSDSYVSETSKLENSGNTEMDQLSRVNSNIITYPQCSINNNIDERNSFAVDYSRLKFEPLSDSYVNETGKLEKSSHTEMDQQPEVTSNLNTSYSQTSINDNITERNYFALDYSRLKIEPLPDSYVKETGTLENSGHTEKDQLSGINSSLITHSQSPINDHIDNNQDSFHTQVNVIESTDHFINTNSKTSTYESRNVDICPPQLKELYDIDKNVAKAVLKAITHLDRKTGVKQSQILKYIKQHKIVRLHSKLNQDVSRFLKSASEARIIKKSLYKYTLSDQVKTIAAEHKLVQKEAKSKTQKQRPEAFNVKTSLLQQFGTIKRKLPVPVRSPILLRGNRGQLKSGTPESTTKVFKKLRSRVVFITSKMA